MKTIAATVLATTLAATALVGTTAVQASANYGEAVCVQGPEGWFPWVIETPEDAAAITGMRVESMPDGIVGCNAYGPVVTEPYVPTPQPSTPQPIPACPAATTAEAPRTTVTADRATIARLRAVIRSLRNR
jgi:hypothetical protein